MRALEELLDPNGKGWSFVRAQLDAATNPYEVLDRDLAAACEALVATQVTTASPMGAIVYETGALLVDHGWLRFLGAGSTSLTRSLPGWNRAALPEQTELGAAGLVLVADDVVGGLFAINGGALSGATGAMHYFAPDTLQWEEMAFGYADFLRWSLVGDLAKFYESFRWEGWTADVRSLSGDRAFQFYPFPWTEEFDVMTSSRGDVEMLSLFKLQMELRAQLGEGA